MFSKTLSVCVIVYLLTEFTYGERIQESFLKDYTYIEAEESYYKFHTTPINWRDAKQVCAQEGTGLMYPENSDEVNAMVSLWKLFQNNTPPDDTWVFIGISDVINEGVYETIDGKAISKVYHNWKKGQPDNSGDEDCIHLNQEGYINDITCDAQYSFICKKTLPPLKQNCSYVIKQSNPDGEKTKKFFLYDYTYIEAVESFYKIHTAPWTWAEAKQVCAQEGAIFWYPENDEELGAVKSFWQTTEPNIPWVYVGLTDVQTKGVFKTVDGKSISEVYHKWMPGQPDNYGGNQDCVYIYIDNNDLDDWKCDSRYFFICKKTLQSLQSIYHCNISYPDSQRPKKFFRSDYSYIEAKDSFYKLHTTPRTWASAKRVCALEGATFWHPDNDDEARAVISLWNTIQPHIGSVYVGMSDVMTNGLFETIDGKSVSEVYNNWQTGQPNNAGGNQDCVYLYKEGHLDDWRCDDKYSFICKKSFQSVKWNYHCNNPDSDYTFNKGNGKCYKLHTTPINWNDSYAVCRLEQSHLAVISNRKEAAFLVNLIDSTPNPRVKENYQRGIYHVGFHNKFKDGWQTVKGTRMNVDADTWWDSHQPADDRDQCGSMFYTGRLISTDCDMKCFFICEHEFVNSCTEPENEELKK